MTLPESRKLKVSLQRDGGGKGVWGGCRRVVVGWWVTVWTQETELCLERLNHIQVWRQEPGQNVLYCPQ